jgi:hypothetical protein
MRDTAPGHRSALGVQRRRRILLTAIAALALAAPVASADRPLVRSADLQVVFRGATECDLTLGYTIEAPSGARLDHRLLLYDGTRVSGLEISNPGGSSTPTAIGRSLSLLVTATGAAQSYRITYRVTQPEERRFRCPVWLPIAPTASGPGSVRLRVQLPPGATALGSYFPIVDWKGSAGEAVLGNVPSLVRAPFALPGQQVFWVERLGTTRLVDITAVGLVVVATAIWALRRRRR